MRQGLCLLGFGAALVLSSPADADKVFSIRGPQFSRLVLPDYTVVDPAKDGKISRSLLRQGKIYFSFTVIGDDKTIRYLVDNDQLEIVAVIYADGFHRRTIKVDIGQDKWDEIREKIIENTKTDGFFTYRSKIYTRLIQYNALEVNLRDGGGNTIARETINIVP